MDIIMFLDDGIWIHPVDQERFKFSGSVVEFMSILVYHTELDIDINSTRFLVHSKSLSYLSW